MTTVLSMKTKIVTSQVEATRDWYRDLFGLAVLEEWNDPDDRGCILGLRSTPGEALLEIHHRRTDHDFSGMGLQFRVDDIDAFPVPEDQRFQSSGPVNRPWGSRYLFFTDPNGMSVVVFSGSSLRGGAGDLSRSNGSGTGGPFFRQSRQPRAHGLPPQSPLYA